MLFLAKLLREWTLCKWLGTLALHKRSQIKMLLLFNVGKCEYIYLIYLSTKRFRLNARKYYYSSCIEAIDRSTINYLQGESAEIF